MIAQESGISLLFGLFKVIILKKIGKRNSHIFCPVGDVVSYEPIIFGRYEFGLTEFIKKMALNNSDSIFIDIGANIGLSSIYVADSFSEIHCFEPNPVCFKILEANTMSLSNVIHLYNVGIGEKTEDALISVPRNNLGGGFILSGDNILTNQEIADKDGFGKFDQDNYQELSVKIMSASDALGPVFSKLSVHHNLIIKIDVEGYEFKLLNLLSKILPLSTNTIIIFENFSNKISLKDIENIFSHRSIDLAKLVSNIDNVFLNSKILKILKLVFFQRKYWLDHKPKSIIGQIILNIKGDNVGAG